MEQVTAPLGGERSCGTSNFLGKRTFLRRCICVCSDGRRTGQGTANEYTGRHADQVTITGWRTILVDQVATLGERSGMLARHPARPYILCCLLFRAGQGTANEHIFGILFYIYIRGGQGTANDHTDRRGTSNLPRGANVPAACMRSFLVLDGHQDWAGDCQ